MRTSAWSAPVRRPHGGAAAHPGRAVGRRARGATASVGGSGRERSPTARRSTAAAVARAEARPRDPRRRGRRRHLQDVGRRRAPARRRRPHPALHRPDPEDQPARGRVTIALGAGTDRPDGEAACRSTRRGPRRAPTEWDARSVAWWLERSGIRTAIGRDLFEMAVRGLFTGDLDDVSFLHLLCLVRAHGSIDTLFSIENGAQENLVDGGAGSIARRVADELGDAVHLRRAGAVDHASATIASWSRRRHSTVSAAPRGRRRSRPRSRSRSRSIPCCPTTGSRSTATRRGPGDEDAGGLRRAVLARRRVQRPDRRSRARRRRSRSTRRPAAGTPGVLASFTFGPVAERVRRARSGGTPRAVLDALDGPARPARGVAGRVRRDAVVEGGVDARAARSRTCGPGS